MSKPIFSKTIRAMIDRASKLQKFIEQCERCGATADNGIISEYESIMAILKAYASARLQDGVAF